MSQEQAKRTIPANTRCNEVSGFPAYGRRLRSRQHAYRRTLELYLRDSLLTQTEQLLLWDERRRLGISDVEHERLLEQLLLQWRKQGKKVTIANFEKPGSGTSA